MPRKRHNCAPGRSTVKSTDNHTNTHTYTYSLSRMTNDKKRHENKTKLCLVEKESIRVRSSWKLHLNKSRFMFYTHTHAHLPTSANNERECGSFAQWSSCPIKYAMLFCTAAAAAELLLPAVAQIRMLSCCTFVYRLATVPVAALAIPAILLSRFRAIQAPIAQQILWNARLIPEEPQFGLHFAAAKGPHEIPFMPLLRVGYFGQELATYFRRHLRVFKV